MHARPAVPPASPACPRMARLVIVIVAMVAKQRTRGCCSIGGSPAEVPPSSPESYSTARARAQGDAFTSVIEGAFQMVKLRWLLGAIAALSFMTAIGHAQTAA